MYSIEIFNKETKERFLANNYENENTRKYYESILAKVAEYEAVEYEKDVYNFTLKELKDLLAAMGSRSSSSLSSIKSVITKYIQWAIDEGLTKSNIDLTDLINKQDIDENVNMVAIKNQYLIDETELDFIGSFCVNAQDAVIFRLLYEGVKGTKYEEIVNLRVEDCDFENNKLTLTRDNGDTRIIEVSEKTMDSIKEAIEQKEYYLENGNRILKDGSFDTRTIEFSHYVVKPAVKTGRRNKNTDKEKIAAIGINNRVSKITEMLDKPFLNPSTIFYSGMLHKLRDIKEQKDLTKEDYINMCLKYGMKESRWFDLKERFNTFIKMQS